MRNTEKIINNKIYSVYLTNLDVIYIVASSLIISESLFAKTTSFLSKLRQSNVSDLAFASDKLAEKLIQMKADMHEQVMMNITI